MDNPDSKISNAKWILERNLSWIATADVKVGAVITLNLALLGGLAAAYAGVGHKSAFDHLLAGATLLLSIVSIVFAKIALVPRVAGPLKSLIFFGPISAMTRPAYLEQIRAITDADFLTDIAQQVHRNAEIACTKHKWVRRAILAMFASGAVWIVALYSLIEVLQK